VLVVAPAAALVLAALVLGSRLGGARPALLAGAVAWGVALTASTELLSAFGALNAATVAASWLVVCGALAVVGWRSGRLSVAIGASRARSHPSTTRCLRLAWPWTLLALGTVALWLALLGVALIAPPNTWDSMTYHMPRVMHWIEDGGVRPYPTGILRQLYMGPGAEFAILHLQLLSGGDRFANLPQALSMLGVMLGVSVIAQQLGGSYPVQVAAALIAGTVPIGVLEATGTQNDEVLAFWLVCFVVFALRVADGPDTASALLAGASLGLAILTKSTTYFFALPFAVWLVLALVGRARRRAWKPLAAIAGLALVLNAGQYARNVLVFESPFGRGDEGGPTFRYMNDALTPPLFASNVVRNLALHLVATPRTAVNRAVADAVIRAHERLGVDVDDPRSTFGDTPFATQFAYGEDTAGNPLHLAVIVLAALLALVWRPPLTSARTRVYGLAVAGGFVLFCAVLRWQPWHSRLQLPLFVLAAPFVALVFGALSRPLLAALGAALLLGAVPYALNNAARPLVGPASVLAVGREQQYFANRPALRAPFLAARDALAELGCRRLGYLAQGNDWEYPLWALTEAADRPLEIEHVAVPNASARFARPFSPCAVVSVTADPTTSIVLDGTMYGESLSAPPITVFAPMHVANQTRAAITDTVLLRMDTRSNRDDHGS
jgi:Dolichyl-phosphate-mannose-protein mannosyltransferase